MSPDGMSDSALAWRIGQLEKQVDELQSKLDKLTIAIVGAALTFALSVGVFAITIVTTGSP